MPIDNDNLENLVCDYLNNAMGLEGAREELRLVLQGNNFEYDAGYYGPLGATYKILRDPSLKEAFRRKVQSDRLAYHKNFVEARRQQATLLIDEIEKLNDDFAKLEAEIGSSLVVVDALEILLGIRIINIDWMQESDEVANYKWDWGSL